MPDITAALQYLAPLPLYKTEKPYLALLANGKEFYEKGIRLDNVEFQDYEGVTVHDMRGNGDLTIDKCGFQVLHHETKHNLKFVTMDDREAYKKETEDLLRGFFDAIYVNTYDVNPRKNVSTAHRKRVDVLDPLYVEGPALGAHNDITLKSGPDVLYRNLTAEEQEKYLRPGYRIRIFNTWRPLHPVCRDRPLALCDSRSIDPEDLITADRVLPHAVGEVYFLGFNQNQKWYWLENQTSSEPFLMKMYDTLSGDHSRICPHISFVNSRAGQDAPPRESVETRSVVITKL